MDVPVITPRSKIVVLTGAGISSESGIATFRDADGLWENHKVEDMATPEGFARDPETVWRFYVQRRKQVIAATPNPAHRALSDLENFVDEGNFLLVTQNVDGLHRRAGNNNLLEIHGSLFRDRCTQCNYRVETNELYEDVPPTCPHCKSMLRPDVVWFGESLHAQSLTRAFSSLAEADLYIAIGTSGIVYPVSMFVYETPASSLYVGVERPQNADGFDEVVLGKAGEKLPDIVKQLTST